MTNLEVIDKLKDLRAYLERLQQRQAEYGVEIFRVQQEIERLQK